MSSASRPRQGDLFAGPSGPGPAAPSDPFTALDPVAPDDSLPLARRQLLEWQERLAAYQAPLWADEEAGQPEQSSLFAAGDAAGQPVAARALRPLALPAESLAFWRWPQAPHQGPALYFVLDRPNHLAQPLLLYVGETARADRRWKGAHDCKSYLAAYREALARAALRATLSIRFWCEAPAATAARRALEQALIQRWKPPFNKETRGRWSTPFTAEVD